MRGRHSSSMLSRKPSAHQCGWLQVTLATAASLSKRVMAASGRCGAAPCRLPRDRCRLLEGAKPASWSQMQVRPLCAAVLTTARALYRREVGATLHVVTAKGEPASPIIALQWLRQVAGAGEPEIIAGAVRCQARHSCRAVE